MGDLFKNIFGLGNGTAAPLDQGVYPLQQYSQSFTVPNDYLQNAQQNYSPFNQHVPAPVGLRALVAADLEDPVFAARIEDLYNAWLVHFGNKWVSLDDVNGSGDPRFYTLAAWRLKKAGKLEEHVISDTSSAVFRIIE